jgi:hypothetical protein
LQSDISAVAVTISLLNQLQYSKHAWLKKGFSAMITHCAALPLWVGHQLVFSFKIRHQDQSVMSSKSVTAFIFTF